MKKILSIFVVLFTFLLVGCDSNTEAPEEITYTGLEEIISYVGDEIGLMSGVTFTSTTRGDITSLVTTSVTEGETFNINDQNVCLMVYSVDYENEETLQAFRRIVVRNEPLVSENNLIVNGGFSNDLDFIVGHTGHNSYPASVFFSRHSDLELLQFNIESVTDSDEYPYYYFNQMTLDSTKTYELSFRMKSSEATTIRMDVAEIPNLLYSVERTIIVNPFNVPVPASTQGMIGFSTTFSPSITTENAYLRIILGSGLGISPTGLIYIDNIVLVEVVD